MANLPKEATVALVDFLSATRRYAEQMDNMVMVALHTGQDAPQAMRDEGEAIVRDAEQALLAILTACFGPPELTFAGGDDDDD